MDRVLPRCLEAEVAVIGCIFDYPDKAFQALSILDTEDFFFRKNKVLFKAIKELTTQGKDANHIAVKDYLENKQLEFDAEHLYSLEEGGGIPSMLDSHARMVKEKSTLRQLITLCKQKENACYDSQDSASNLIETIQEKLCDISLDHVQKIKKDLVKSPNEWVGDLIQNVEHAFEYPDEKVKEAITTSYKDLEQYTGGARNVNILSAYSGIGKTALALNMAVQYAVKSRIPTLYLNYEMAIQELSNRVVSILSNQKYKSIETGIYEGEHVADIEKVRKAYSELGEAPLYLTHNDGKSVATSISLIEKYALTHKIKMVFVDHLLDISPDDQSFKETEYITFGRYIQMFKEVCSKHNIKLWILVQQGRSDNRGTSLGVQGSIKILQKADQFLVMSQSYDKQSTYLTLDKNRHGSYPFKWKLPFNKDTQKIESNWQLTK